VKLVGPEPRSQAAFSLCRARGSADIVGAVEEACRGDAGQIDQQVRVQHAHAVRPPACQPAARCHQRTRSADFPADRGQLNSGPKILPDAHARLPRRDEAGHDSKSITPGASTPRGSNANLLGALERPRLSARKCRPRSVRSISSSSPHPRMKELVATESRFCAAPSKSISPKPERCVPRRHRLPPAPRRRL